MGNLQSRCSKADQDMQELRQTFRRTAIRLVDFHPIERRSLRSQGKVGWGKLYMPPPAHSSLSGPVDVALNSIWSKSGITTDAGERTLLLADVVIFDGRHVYEVNDLVSILRSYVGGENGRGHHTILPSHPRACTCADLHCLTAKEFTIGLWQTRLYPSHLHCCPHPGLSSRRSPSRAGVRTGQAITALSLLGRAGIILSPHASPNVPSSTKPCQHRK